MFLEKNGAEQESLVCSVKRFIYYSLKKKKTNSIDFTVPCLMLGSGINMNDEYEFNKFIF
jgi:hypothetical protein